MAIYTSKTAPPMSESTKTHLSDKPLLDKISADIMRPVRQNRAFILWMGFLTVALAACLYAYTIQLQKGLIVTGLRDYISWGMYISNFVFFVATSLVGMLISAVLGLIGYTWVKPIARIAEIIAVAFAAVAGLVIISDMGRPDRLPYLFMYGRIQSPILWDVTVVTTYFAISLLLYFIPMIPDLAIARTRMEHAPAWLRKVYKILSLRWVHKDSQYRIIRRSIRILLILIVPTAFAIHTVTSWLFAVTPRAGWDSTIFGPYFLTGAFVAGTAAVIIAMFFFRNNYKLGEYITHDHFDKMGRLLVLVAIVYLYFNLNEFLVPGYKLKKFDAIHLHSLFAGHRAILFWSTQLGGLVIPMFLLMFRRMRRPLSAMLISIFILAGSWLKRFIIVVPTQEHPYLPIQHVPTEWMVYKPTLIETAVTMATIILAVMIITILSKTFPVLPIWEITEEKSKEKGREISDKNN